MTSLDENSRRYYLDMMGVQCWQALNPDTDTVTATVTSAAGVASTAPAAATAAPVDNVLEEVTGNQPNNDTLTAHPLNWQTLDNDIQQCSHCQLHQTLTQTVTGQKFTGRGNQSAQLMIVMLSAGINPEAIGLLTKMLAAINITIEDVYITSLLKCDVPVQHTVTTSEINACSNFLNQQIQLVQPKQLFVLGETAIRCVFQKDIDLDSFRQQVNVVTTGHTGLASPLLAEKLPLLVSYSPQELLQQPENKRKSWSDLQQLQTRMQA